MGQSVTPKEKMKMETKFNFKSQVCTDKVQSERLLALGLKKETADCYYWQENDHIYGEATGVWHLETLYTEDTQEHFEYLDKYFGVCLADDEEHYFIPAWSLHRLIEMADTTTYINEGREDEHELWFCMDKCYCWNNHESFYATNLYDSLIRCIEWRIEKGYFNKEYLENGK